MAAAMAQRLTKAAGTSGVSDISPQPGFTFEVEPNVKPSGPCSYGKDRRRLREPETSDTIEEAWGKMGGQVEAMSPTPPGTVAVFTKQNLFAKAVHAAFFDHHPLILSPDVIWLTIAQGLSHHVDQNAETLREKFVHHEGKKELVIQRPGFIKGSPANDWEAVFPEFSALIKANTVEGTAELVENNFSTSGPVERVVSHITLMDAVQHYFSYTMCCGCGFPSITLTGTVEDWKNIREKAEALRNYELDWWLEGLLPVLDQFVEAVQGRPDLDFWRSLCMINTGTSFPNYEPLTGWVQVFFPYLISPGVDSDPDGSPKRALIRNGDIANYVESYTNKVNAANFGEEQGPDSGEEQGPDSGEEQGPDSGEEQWQTEPQGVRGGVELELFPPSMSSAPFTYIDAATGKQHMMAFFGGITCLVQHASGAIEPKMGWAVLDSGKLKGQM